MKFRENPWGARDCTKPGEFELAKARSTGPSFGRGSPEFGGRLRLIDPYDDVQALAFVGERVAAGRPDSPAPHVTSPIPHHRTVQIPRNFSDSGMDLLLIDAYHCI
jgi:hypothetical protein